MGILESCAREWENGGGEEIAPISTVLGYQSSGAENTLVYFKLDENYAAEEHVIAKFIARPDTEAKTRCMF